MLHNITIGKYYKTPSFIHEMNPLSKLICTLIFILGTLLCRDLLSLSILSFLLLGGLLLTRIPAPYYLKSIFSLKWFYLGILLINMIFGILPMDSFVMILKMIFIILYTSLLTMTTPPTETTYAFEKLLFPLSKLKLSPSKISLSLSLSLNFIPIIIQQSNKILKTISSKGIDFKRASIKDKMKVMKAMVIPMFTLSIRQSDHISDMMEVRNFDIDKVRTNYRMNKWRILDSCFMLFHVIILVTIIVKEVFV